MKLKYWCALMSGLLFTGCFSEPVQIEDPINDKVDYAEGDNTGLVAGWVRIKLEENVEPLQVGVFTRGEVSTGNAALDEVVAQLGATEVRRVFKDGGRFAERRRSFGLHLWYEIKIDENLPVTRASRNLADIPGIARAEAVPQLVSYAEKPSFPEYVPTELSVASFSAETECPFDDPDFSKQWYLYNDGSVKGAVPGCDIHVLDAWKKYGAGIPSVVVSVSDEGVDISNEDIINMMWVNEAELYGTEGVDDDGNGYIDDVYGYNFVDDNGILSCTEKYHATAVGGVIAAENNNGIGVCGIAGGTGNGDGVRIMSLQIFGDNSNDNNFSPVDAFAYAADNGAVISHNSWGYTVGTINDYQSLADAIDYFIEYAGTDLESGEQTGPMRGGVVVCSAGNDLSSRLSPPADYDPVIAVAACGPNYRKSFYSNYSSLVDILAPGGAQSTGGYVEDQIFMLGGYAKGTSFAAPMVSGVAALMVSHFAGEGFTSEECRLRVLGCVRPYGEYADSYAPYLGRGFLDASLIDIDFLDTPPAAVNDLKTVPLAEGVKLSCTMPTDANGMSVVRAHLTFTPNNSSTADVVNELIILPEYSSVFEHETTLEGEILYTVSVVMEDRFGNMSEPATADFTTLPHANNAPVIKNPMGDRVLNERVKELKIDLSVHFSDPDASYGDVLTYEISCSDPKIVNYTVSDQNLIITAKNKGETTITVVASDTYGESCQASFKVTVNYQPEGGNDDDDNNDPSVPNDPTTPDGDVNVRYANPVDDVLEMQVLWAANSNVDVEVLDSSARVILRQTLGVDQNGVCLLDVKNVIPGIYNLAVKSGENSWNGTFVKK